MSLPRRGLFFSVDEANVRPRQIGNSRYAFGVARRDNKSLVSDNEIDQNNAFVRQMLLQERIVEVSALRVKQMNAGKQAVVVFDGADPAHTG